MPLLWLGCAFISGIALAAYYVLQEWLWSLLFWFGLLGALIEFYFVPKSRHPLLARRIFKIPFGLLLAACALGGWRFHSHQPSLSPQDLAWYQPSERVVVVGTVSSYPQQSSRATTAVIDAVSINLDGRKHEVSGRLELRLPAGFRLTYGERLRLEGKLDAAIKKGRPYFTANLTRTGIFSRMAYPQIETVAFGYGSPLMHLIYGLRSRAQQLIYSQLPFPESALLEGILLGIEWNIPDFLRQAYRATGTIHIIAISGFNIALISNLVVRLFRRVFPLEWAGVLAFLAITFYTLLVGAEPAVVRAAIMGSLAIPAHYFGRRIFGMHILVIAASGMLLFNPFLLWDISFQLSFLATLGLMVLVDPLADLVRSWLEQRLPEHSVDRFMPLAMLFITTLAAQFAVSPVLLALDPHLPVFSLLANLIVLPLQPVVMVLGGLSVLIGLVLPPAGALLAWLVWPFIALGNQSALRFSLNPYTLLRLPTWSAGSAAVLVAFALLLASAVQLRALTQKCAAQQR